VDVGYMPQDIALQVMFTVGEVLSYYAKLHGLTQEFFEERKQFLMSFLEIPPDHRIVGSLSGGQQRRLSLAVALLQNPKLLILDEPTVGVDPLLRARIWKYLVEVARSGVSIIITTHYIEEAKAADMVGLMRNGRLLDEGPPQVLMSRYGHESLEDTFLHLCQAQEAELAKQKSDDEDAKANGLSLPLSASDSFNNSLNSLAAPLLTSVAVGSAAGSLNAPNSPPPNYHSTGMVYQSEEGNEKVSYCAEFGPRKRVITAELYKGFTRMRRNVAFIIFQFLIPSLQVVLFCLAIGKPPENLNLGIVNFDAGHNGTMLSQSIIDDLPSHSFHKINYHSVDDALHAVRHGSSWGVLHFPETFTENLILRYKYNDVDPAIINGSVLDMTLDMSNQQIASFIVQEVQTAFTDMAISLSPNARQPLILNAPVYGSASPKFTDFIAPGMIISIAFAQAISGTAVTFVLDKKSGTMDRSWAAGVRPSEVMASQMVLQFCTLFFQIAFLLFFALVIFSLPMKGSIALVMFLAMSLGMTGMMCGLVISAVCEDEQQAMQLALGSFFPVLLLSGIIWPIEAVPMGLRYISYALPTTHAATAMRSIMSRGWGMDEKGVWTGFAVIGGWIAFLFLSAVKSLKAKSP